MTEDIVNMLWTGGYDSTYRLLQLSRHDLTIQPYYIINKERLSLKEEEAAMEKILALLAVREDRRAEILPPIRLDKDDFYPLPEGTEAAYKSIRARAKIGSQYLWLSAVAASIPGLEISWEHPAGSLDQASDADKLIFRANFQTSGEGLLAYRQLDPENNPADLLKIFGNFRFPLAIQDRSKKDALADYKAWDAMDIASATWFCSQPMDGEPCGYCGPCRDVMEEGMAFRMPEASLRRYHNRVWWLLRYKFLKTWHQLVH